MNNVKIIQDLCTFTPNPGFISSTPLEFRAKWGKALRSHTNGQAHGKMIDHKGAMCCLMVGHTAFNGNDSQRGAFIPGALSPFAIAMNHPTPCIALLDGKLEASAIQCNDSYLLTLLQIADLVHPEGADSATYT